MARLQLGTNEMITILDKLRNSNDSDMTEKERYWTALEILEIETSKRSIAAPVGHQM